MRENKYIFKNLVAEMARYGYTTEKLANEIGITKQGMYNKLCGTYQFTLKEVNAIQKIMQEKNKDLDINYLFKYDS